MNIEPAILGPEDAKNFFSSVGGLTKEKVIEKIKDIGLGQVIQNKLDNKKLNAKANIEKGKKISFEALVAVGLDGLDRLDSYPSLKAGINDLLSEIIITPRGLLLTVNGKSYADSIRALENGPKKVVLSRIFGIIKKILGLNRGFKIADGVVRRRGEPLKITTQETRDANKVKSLVGRMANAGSAQAFLTNRSAKSAIADIRRATMNDLIEKVNASKNLT
jgi:hypothetical protein